MSRFSRTVTPPGEHLRQRAVGLAACLAGANGLPSRAAMTCLRPTAALEPRSGFATISVLPSSRTFDAARHERLLLLLLPQAPPTRLASPSGRGPHLERAPLDTSPLARPE